MGRTKELIDEYRSKYGKNISQNQFEHLRIWLIGKTGKDIPGDLIVTIGSGGGQKYRLLYLAQDINGNAGRPCTFYCEMPQVEKEMIRLGHTPLEKYIEGE